MPNTSASSQAPSQGVKWDPALELGCSLTCSLSSRPVPHLDSRLLKSHCQERAKVFKFIDHKNTQIVQCHPASSLEFYIIEVSNQGLNLPGKPGSPRSPFAPAIPGMPTDSPWSPGKDRQGGKAIP